MKTFSVRLEVKAGKCIFTDAVLPAFTEELQIKAADRRAAYRRVPIEMKGRLMGQVMHVYIDGVQEFAAA